MGRMKVSINYSQMILKDGVVPVTAGQIKARRVSVTRSFDGTTLAW